MKQNLLKLIFFCFIFCESLVAGESNLKAIESRIEAALSSVDQTIESQNEDLGAILLSTLIKFGKNELIYDSNNSVFKKFFILEKYPISLKKKVLNDFLQKDRPTSDFLINLVEDLIAQTFNNFSHPTQMMFFARCRINIDNCNNFVEILFSPYRYNYSYDYTSIIEKTVDIAVNEIKSELSAVDRKGESQLQFERAFKIILNSIAALPTFSSFLENNYLDIANEYINKGAGEDGFSRLLDIVLEQIRLYPYSDSKHEWTHILMQKLDCYCFEMPKESISNLKNCKLYFMKILRNLFVVDDKTFNSYFAFQFLSHFKKNKGGTKDFIEMFSYLLKCKNDLQFCRFGVDLLVEFYEETKDNEKTKLLAMLILKKQPDLIFEVSKKYPGNAEDLDLFYADNIEKIYTFTSSKSKFDSRFVSFTPQEMSSTMRGITITGVTMGSDKIYHHLLKGLITSPLEEEDLAKVFDSIVRANRFNVNFLFFFVLETYSVPFKIKVLSNLIYKYLSIRPFLEEFILELIKYEFNNVPYSQKEFLFKKCKNNIFYCKEFVETLLSPPPVSLLSRFWTSLNSFLLPSQTDQVPCS